VGIETHLEKFGEQRREHLDNIRGLRHQVWLDETLDPIDRVVLGLTSSADQLNQKRGLARTIGQLVGEPLIVINRVGSNGRPSLATGGVIAGELCLGPTAHAYNNAGQAKGHAELVVPVINLVSLIAPGTNCHNVAGNLTVAHISYDELGNSTTNPERDYTDKILCSSVLIGREAIFDSEHFKEEDYFRNFMLAIENTVPRPPQQTT